MYLYYDAKHAAEEETDNLRRVDDGKYENYTMYTYALKAPQFGTIALMVSGQTEPKAAFDDYKTRCEVEQEIDVLKTDLDALTSYMHDDARPASKGGCSSILLLCIFSICSDAI